MCGEIIYREERWNIEVENAGMVAKEQVKSPMCVDQFRGKARPALG